MQRFFFHTADGSRDRDDEGTVLADLASARIEAIKYAGECLANQPGLLWDTRDFRVEVTDERDMLLFTVITLAVNAPAAGDTK